MRWKSRKLHLYSIGILAVLLAAAIVPLRDTLFAERNSSSSSSSSSATGSLAPPGPVSVPGAPVPPPATLTPAPTEPSPTPPPARGFLHTEGAGILDGSGDEVRITGINWFGMETGTFAPHGIWARRWGDLLDVVVELGFNTVRLPYSDDIFKPDSKPNGIDFHLNPDLEGLKPLEIMDRIVGGASQRGLKVILDRHRPDQYGQSNLWYTDKVSEERWIEGWKQLALRYWGNDAVVGADLHNEPHGGATWGDGNPKTDWRLAAERAGNAILAVNPDWLIIVEGVDSYKGNGYWWGGNLRGVADAPVRLAVPGRLVYSAHDYGPGVHNQSWFSDPSFPNNLPGIWDSHWAFVQKQGIAPVLMGEFGGRSVGTDPEGIWQRALVGFLRERGISYTYWTLNPNSGDTGGILRDDWRTIDIAKRALLSTYLWPLAGAPGTEPARR